jgi:hypothetical protein
MEEDRLHGRKNLQNNLRFQTIPLSATALICHPKLLSFNQLRRIGRQLIAQSSAN